MTSTPYVRSPRAGIPSPAELRARIPGWGVDLDPKDRPAFPREVAGLPAQVHWDYPAEQPERSPRERSLEHLQLTPVFGTTLPPRGLSGAVRRVAYSRFSEARAAHWLLLLVADRVDVVETALRGLPEGRPRAWVDRSLAATTGIVEKGVRQDQSAAD